MSTYINEYTILSAIKSVLDADSTLDTLLNVKGSSSKVILGIERPDVCAMPTVHLSFLTRTIQVDTKMNTVLIRVSWFVSAYGEGREDVKGLADIGERIYDLLDDHAFSITGYKVDSFCAESGESSAKDIQEPEGRPNHFQSLTFRASIRRIA